MMKKIKNSFRYWDLPSTGTMTLMAYILLSVVIGAVVWHKTHDPWWTALAVIFFIK